MRLLREHDVHEYCQGESDEALGVGLLDEAMKAGSWPALIVPLFELCRAVHFGARSGLGIEHFRECWQKLVDWHYEKSLDGYLLMPLAIEEDGQSLFQEIFSHGRIRPEDIEPGHQVSQGRADPRDQPRDPAPFTACFRKLAGLRMERLGASDAQKRRWDNLWPDEIPEHEPYKQIGNDLVLDTNIFVELLEALPVNGIFDLDQHFPWQEPSIARILAGAKTRFRDALWNRGSDNKLIIPVSVLVEAYGVVHARRDGKYQNARAVLTEMARQQDQWPLWDAFPIEELSLDVFGAFLGLHELLVERVEDRLQWPDFADSFVIAHALYNGCPVASAEWVDKPECWASVRAHYPFLHPGG